MNHPNRYLLLGEGNFTFAASLSRHLFRDDKRGGSRKGGVAEVVATSFDSEEQVLSKYPEARGVLSQLQQFSQLVHGVDATRPLVQQLASGEDKNAALFDCIIFNFPHLGVEDARMHSSMLAHSMACIGAALRDDSSVFVLTLADAQAVRWRMEGMAARNGLELIEALAFRDTDWPGYEIKRHQSGKSFKSRVKDCSYFLFRKASPTKQSGTVKHALHIHLLELRSVALPLDATVKCCKRKEAGGYGEGEGPKGKQRGKDSKKSKRVFITSTNDCFVETLQDGAATFECLKCQRKFSSEHAVRTHIYSFHVLTGTATADTAIDHVDGPDSTTCMQCDKSFDSSHALLQHCRSVHGRHAPAKPCWAAASSTGAATTISTTTATLADGAHECSICGFVFTTHEELQSHALEGTQPRDKTLRVPCLTCNRLFLDERSLSQHLNVCKTIEI